MPEVRFLATFDGNHALELPLTELASASVSLEGLREMFSKQTGQDAYILHTDGLGLEGENKSLTVRLELAVPSALATTPYPPLPHTRPWQRPGWFSETLPWLEAALGKRITRLEQVSTNDMGAVLRAETVSQAAYVKTSGRGLEATMSAHIASMHPDLTPNVIAWDTERNLLLTEDCAPRLSETADLERWRSAVNKLAHFQRTADGAALHKLGCSTHSFDDLAARAEQFLKNTSVLEGWGLNPEQIAGLQTLLPAIVTAHERVQGLELPLLPAHGDAHPMNVLTGCDVVLFDWSDTCLAHPLLDSGWFLAWTLHPGRAKLPLRPRHPHAARTLWRTYLDELSLTDIRMGDALRLALVHRALVGHERYMHWQGTLPGWRPQYVPYLLRSLLRLEL